MDNIQFWIWLIVIIVTFSARAKKKKPEGDTTTFGGEPVDRRTNPADKPISFEDLLREIRDAQSPKRDDPKPVILAQEEIPREEKIREKPVLVRRSQAPVEKVEMDEEAQFYQGAYNTAFQTTTKLSETSFEGSLLKADAYQNTQKINRYAQILKNPETLRESLIVSEILKPKHF
jgi:hypothetical protein